jgi:hypothetical protein
MHASAAQFDEEKDVEPLKPNRLHSKEVNGEQASAMRSEKLAPPHPATGAGCGRETEPVRPRHRRPAASTSENGQLVPQNDDFQVFELVRPNAQDRELKQPLKRRVPEREEHESSETAILCIRLGVAPPSRGGWPERET